MRLLLLHIVFLSVLGTFAQESTFTLRIEGEGLNTEEIADGNKINSVDQAEPLLSDLITELYKEGYVSASVDSIVTDSASSTVTGYIYKGQKFKWTRLHPGNADEGMLSKIRFREQLYREAPLNINRLNKLIERILVYYENNGYPFSSVRLDSFNFKDETAEAVLNVEKGKKIKFDSLVIVSEDKLPERFIFNYVGIRKGDLYSEALLGRIPDRIDELSFAAQLRNPEIIFTEDETTLILTLERQKANNIDGILGFQPQEDESEETILTGEVDIILRNALGVGELIKAQWRRLQAGTSTLDLGTEFPYLFNTRFGVEANLNIFRLDTAFMNVNQRWGIQYYLRGDRHITGFINRSSTSLINTEQYEDATTLPENADVSFTSYGLAFKTSDVDYKFNPSRGFELYIEGATGVKNIEQNPALENINYDTIELSTSQYNGRTKFDHYLPVSPRFTLNNQFQGGFMINENLFRNELFRIGGLHTLRGFDEESIFVSNYMIYKSELRFKLEKNSFVYAFFNGAWYERDISSEYVSDMPFGFGLGVNFETNAGIFTINYALGRQFDNPIEMRSGKIHFGFANYF